MTGSAIEQLDTQLWVILGAFSVTFQTKTHIESLWILVNIYFGQIAMTGLTIDSRCDVRTMIIVHEIRHHRYWYPLERLVILHSLDQGFQLFAALCNGQLLVTAPTLCLGWKAGHRSA